MMLEVVLLLQLLENHSTDISKCAFTEGAHSNTLCVPACCER